MYQLSYRREKITRGLKIIVVSTNKDHRYSPGSCELDLASFLF